MSEKKKMVPLMDPSEVSARTLGGSCRAHGEDGESTIRDERQQLIEDLERERIRAEKLEEELRKARKSWWSKIFGG